MYIVKTRNWRCNKRVKKLLDFSCNLGVKTDSNYYYDNDGSYWIETSNKLLAWTVWAYFMLLRRFSGGWTYIIRQGKELTSGYKSIY